MPIPASDAPPPCPTPHSPSPNYSPALVLPTPKLKTSGKSHFFVYLPRQFHIPLAVFANFFYPPIGIRLGHMPALNIPLFGRRQAQSLGQPMQAGSPQIAPPAPLMHHIVNRGDSKSGKH